VVGNISQWCHSGLDPESRFYVPLHRYPETGSRWFQQPAPSVTVKVVEQTRPKGTRLPGVCIKTGNKDEKIGKTKVRPSALFRKVKNLYIVLISY
jgi:hypothetical protein